MNRNELIEKYGHPIYEFQPDNFEGNDYVPYEVLVFKLVREDAEFLGSVVCFSRIDKHTDKYTANFGERFVINELLETKNNK